MLSKGEIILFCFVLFCFVLFCFLFCFVFQFVSCFCFCFCFWSCFWLVWIGLCHDLGLCHGSWSRFALFCVVLFGFVWSCFVLFCFVLLLLCFFCFSFILFKSYELSSMLRESYLLFSLYILVVMNVTGKPKILCLVMKYTYDKGCYGKTILLRIFCFVLFCSVLFCFALLCFILSCLVFFFFSCLVWFRFFRIVFVLVLVLVLVLILVLISVLFCLFCLLSPCLVLSCVQKFQIPTPHSLPCRCIRREPYGWPRASRVCCKLSSWKHAHAEIANPVLPLKRNGVPQSMLGREPNFYLRFPPFSLWGM